MSDLRAASSSFATRRALRRGWLLLAAGALAVVLVIAWIDGGERPLRPISEPVDLPAAAGSTAP